MSPPPLASDFLGNNDYGTKHQHHHVGTQRNKYTGSTAAVMGPLIVVENIINVIFYFKENPVSGKIAHTSTPLRRSGQHEKPNRQSDHDSNRDIGPSEMAGENKSVRRCKDNDGKLRNLAPPKHRLRDPIG